MKSKSQVSFSHQLFDAESQHLNSSPEGKKWKKVEERKPIKSNFCASVLSVSEAELNETMQAWNSLMEAVCFQPWLFLKEPQIRAARRGKGLSSYTGRGKLSLWWREEPLVLLVQINWCSYLSGFIKTLWVHGEGQNPVNKPLLFLEQSFTLFSLKYPPVLHIIHLSRSLHYNVLI